jgi:hypothetical protein
MCDMSDEELRCMGWSEEQILFINGMQQTIKNQQAINQLKKQQLKQKDEIIREACKVIVCSCDGDIRGKCYPCEFKSSPEVKEILKGGE